MATQLIGTYSSISNIDLGTTDDVIVAAGAIVVVPVYGYAIFGNGSGHAALIYGSVFGLVGGIHLGFSATSNQYLLVGSSGSVAGGEYGAIISGINSRIVNHGSIAGERKGLLVDAGSSGTLTVFNDGAIDSRDDAIFRLDSPTAQIILRNFGTITGGTASFDGGTSIGVDKIINRGIMVGDIKLGGGADAYDGRGGLVEGNINGGDGDDRFFAGAAVETFRGDAGRDSLNFSFETSVRMSLDGSVVGTGSAHNDRYSSIEDVFGSSGSDYIAGDAAANGLYGGLGVDTLIGGASADTLIGGAGADVFLGGSGSDRFEFYAPTDGGDKILDFTNAVGNNDVIVLYSTDFGAGLTAGPLAAAKFYQGSTNICTGVEDRIILRTTDNTVWFDSNGKAAGGLTMLADLQAGVVVTAADFLILL